MKAMRVLPILLCMIGAPSAANAQVGEPVRSEARLRPGDVIRVRIWREEGMSGEFIVSGDGVVVLPKLGPYTVTDRLPTELRAQLVKDYQRYLRNPSIEITFLKRITIMGAVRDAGIRLVDETMTVAEALALAGGTRPEGATDRIELIRDGRRLLTVTERTRIGEMAMQSGDRLFVPERNWTSRNPGVVAAVISGVVTLVVALLVR